MDRRHLEASLDTLTLDPSVRQVRLQQAQQKLAQSAQQCDGYLRGYTVEFIRLLAPNVRPPKYAAMSPANAARAQSRGGSGTTSFTRSAGSVD